MEKATFYTLGKFMYPTEYMALAIASHRQPMQGSMVLNLGQMTI